MNIKNMSKTTLLVLAFGVATMASSQAAYINGEIRFGGLGTLDSPATTATAINFLGALTIAVSGDYSPIPVLDVIPPTLSVGTPVTFTDFVFGAPGTVGPNAQSPLWTLSFGGDTYSFDLTAITINSVVGTQRNIEGTGVAKITGFDDTPGHWSLSTSGESTTISFSSSTTAAAPVPDGGTSVALLGGSLLGLAGLRRKFLRN